MERINKEPPRANKKPEAELEKEFDHLKIRQPQRERLKTTLADLEKHDRPTYEHCIRVGVMGAKVGELLSIDPKALFYSGLLHDIGKTAINQGLLRKKSGYTGEDHESMKEHVTQAYAILGGTYKFSAEVSLRHHSYQKSPYPLKLPLSMTNFDTILKSS